MEFDKSRVYTALNADELKAGSEVFLADNMQELKGMVEDGDSPRVLEAIRSEDSMYRFATRTSAYCLAYLVSPVGEKVEGNNSNLNE